MSEPVLELVEFRTSGGAAALHRAVQDMDPWLRAQAGFRWRRLAQFEDGALLDLIEWADAASATAAADQIMTAPQVAGFMALIDGSSVVMRHARILVSR